MHSHYTIWQLVKYIKKWNSFDLITNVDGLNNFNNVVVKRIKTCETSECFSMATISALIEALQMSDSTK